MTLRERIQRLVPIDGWSIAILLWTLLFGVVMRAWRIVDFLWGTDDWSDLQWLPKSVGVDIGFALLVWLVCGVVLAFGPRWLARGWSIIVLGLVIFFGVANALSFHVSGSALTFHRLRGDDGATTRDMDKFAWGDVWPILVLLAFSLASVAVTLALAHRFERTSPQWRRRVVLVVALASVVSLTAYEALWEGRDRGYGRHPVGVFVESVLQVVGADPDIGKDYSAPHVTDAGWRRLFTPQHPQRPPPPMPARALADGAPAHAKNAIVFFAEGIPYKHTSLDPNGPNTTPLLKARAAKQGLEMTRFYSPFHMSIEALFSLFCGDYPTPNGKSITELNPRIDCGEMGEVMKKNGVHPGVFHGGYFSFYDKTAFLADRAYEIELDAPALRTKAPPQTSGAPYFENAWGIDDRAMVRATLAWIDSLPKDERFSAVLIPITAHYPYQTPDDVERPFGETRKIDRFWNSVHFVDIAFDELMRGLEKRGLMDDTLVIFLADHGESPHEPPRETNVDRAMYEYDVRVPFVMFNGRMFPTAQKSERLSAIPDIFPTVLDALDLPDVRERQGRSFLAPDWQEQRIFLGASRSNVHQIGFLDGHEKFIFDLGTGRSELYDLEQDPDELRNLARDHKDVVARNTDTVLTYSKWQLARIRDWPTIGDAVDVQGRLGHDFHVEAFDNAGKRVECTPTDKDTSKDGIARSCPGFSPETFAGLQRIRVSERERSCMSIRLPPGGGGVELTTADRDYFRYVTNIRFAFGPGRSETDGVAQLTLDIDDQPSQVMNLNKRWKNRRFVFGAPTKSLKLTVAADEEIKPAVICLFFGDSAWRPRRVPDAADNGDDARDDAHDDLAPGTDDPADPPVAP